jgi:hypothetical protein
VLIQNNHHIVIKYFGDFHQNPRNKKTRLPAQARKSGFACRSSNNFKKASYQFHFAPQYTATKNVMSREGLFMFSLHASADRRKYTQDKARIDDLTDTDSVLC